MTKPEKPRLYPHQIKAIIDFLEAIGISERDFLEAIADYYESNYRCYTDDIRQLAANRDFSPLKED